MPYCWKCSAPYVEFKKTPDFHATCDKCNSYWHSCCNCRHFTGYPTALCRVPNVNPVHDREGANFCDEFCLAEKLRENSKEQRADDARQKWNDLFGD